MEKKMNKKLANVLCAISLVVGVIGLCFLGYLGLTYKQPPAANESASVQTKSFKAVSGLTVSYSNYILTFNKPDSSTYAGYIVKYFSTDAGSGVGITASTSNRVHTFSTTGGTTDTLNIQFLYDSGALKRGTIYYCYLMEPGGASTDTSRWSSAVEIKEMPPQIGLPENPTKEGHTFVGWYMDANFNTAYSGQPIYEDTPLYAKFEINKFTVSFIDVDNTAISSQTVDWNTAAELPTHTKEGFNFVGWFLPNGTQYTNQPITENTQLKAKWAQIIFTVTFYVNGEVYQTVQVPYGATLAEALEAANLLLYNVTGAKDYAGQKITGNIITDSTIEIVKMSVNQIVKGLWSEYKWWVICAGIALGAIILIIILVNVFKRPERR